MGAPEIVIAPKAVSSQQGTSACNMAGALVLSVDAAELAVKEGQAVVTLYACGGLS